MQTKHFRSSLDKGVQLIDKQSRKGAEGLNIGSLHPKSTIESSLSCATTETSSKVTYEWDNRRALDA